MEVMKSDYHKTALTLCLLSGIVIPVLYLLPYFLLGENSFITIHDNLDSEFVYRCLTAKQEFIFSNGSVIPQVMNGLPRFCMPSGYNVVMWLFFIFSPLQAYLINELMVRMIAFMGMFLLLNKLIVPAKKYDLLIVWGVSVCFTLIPFYSIYGISVAGQPLLLYAFANLWSGNRKWYNWLIIVIFPLYSSLVMSGFFVGIALGAVGCIRIIRHRQFCWPYWTGLLLFTTIYLFVEQGLFVSYFLSPDFVSSRTEWKITEFNIIQMIKDAIFLLARNHYHAGILFVLPIVITVLYSIYQQKALKMISLISVGILAIVVIFFVSYPVKYYLGDKIHFLVEFQWNRFYFLLPILWMLLFAVPLTDISKRKIVIALLLVFQAGVVIAGNNEYKTNVAALFGKQSEMPSYKAFFATDLFEQAADYIGHEKSDYRVLNIGLHPAIAQYNGFYTLDSYQNNYELDYKHAFRKIIEPELNKNIAIRKHFDNWGSRCYTFAAELNQKILIGKSQESKITHLHLNIEELHIMRAKYIFSSVEILYPSDGISFERKFTNLSAYYDLYLYRID